MENWSITKPSVHAQGGVVVSQHYLAAQAGARVLEQGGKIGEVGEGDREKARTRVDKVSPVISTLISLDTTLCGIATLDAAKHSVYVEKMQRSQSANPFQRSVVFRPFTAAHVCPSIAAAHVHP